MTIAFALVISFVFSVQASYGTENTVSPHDHNYLDDDLDRLKDESNVVVAEDEKIVIDGGSIQIELRKEAQSEPSSDAVTPLWSVGFGWNIYIYMTGSEANTFSTYSAGALASVICGSLLDVISAAVCATLAAILVDILTNYAYTSWRCYEFAFTYTGQFSGFQEVSTSHC